MNPILEKALKSLSITCNTTALPPVDEDRIKVTLKTLYKKGVTIDISNLESWLANNGWKKNPSRME